MAGEMWTVQLWGAAVVPATCVNVALSLSNVYSSIWIKGVGVQNRNGLRFRTQGQENSTFSFSFWTGSPITQADLVVGDDPELLNLPSARITGLGTTLSLCGAVESCMLGKHSTESNPQPSECIVGCQFSTPAAVLAFYRMPLCCPL